MADTDLKVQVNIVDGGDGDADHDPHYDPIISLPEVAVSTNEEDEVELIKLRAKLYRYDTNENPPEWKERGTGDVKLLRHQTKNTVRVVMRRDKTLKICANHFVTPHMEMKPNCGSDRAWVWSALADYTNETAQTELLAIRFANADNAKKWKEMFEEAKTIVATECDLYTKVPDDSEDEEAESSENDEENNVEESLKNLNLSDTKTEKNDSIKGNAPITEAVDK
uniref:RanBD1 domain-containing protein n=2 Tax=Graphocephala atropunctata TaxID=36148 RepID=A0A1B6M3B8_9HEMI